MSLRKIFFWCHLTVGIGVGLVVAFLAVTGLLLSFQNEVIGYAERGYRLPQAAATTGCAAPSEMLVTAETVARRRATSLITFADRARPAEVAFGHERTVLLHPCTGALLSATGSSLRLFFWEVRDAHQAVTLQGVRHQTLRQIKNAANVGFVFLMVSGLVIWLPRKFTWQHTRPGLVPRWKAKGRAFNWSWHNVAGIWFVVPLLCIAASGAVLAYPWANALLYRAAGEVLPPRQERGEVREAEPLAVKQYGLLNAAMVTAQQVDPLWKSVEMRIPTSADKNIAFTVEEGKGGKPWERVRVQVKRKSGEVGKIDRYTDNTRARRWRLNARYLHTGELFGVIGKTIAALSMIALLALVWTGFALSLNRFRNWRKRKAAAHKKAPVQELQAAR
ncbi:PepSY-associated TM helix domain-containing protein [Terriglobus tenax]|uniref:PepSY-associated TM helix domain-containing protein n=1 Tax=Terriglobus tenax TaxID=1111115 RepID=UPI0021E0E87E|nr:PepSY-associated TM helix domain-containing protein [Terriglobus tenax]